MVEKLRVGGRKHPAESKGLNESVTAFHVDRAEARDCSSEFVGNHLRGAFESRLGRIA